MKYKKPFPDFTKEPIEIALTYAIYLEGDLKPKEFGEFCGFKNIDLETARKNKWFATPHEWCLIQAMEFARRYPNHPRSKYWREHPEFSDEEIIQICRGDKKLIINSDSYNKYYLRRNCKEGTQNLAKQDERPDFSRQPLDLVRLYSYNLEGDNLSKPRSIVYGVVFRYLQSETAEVKKWVQNDIEFCYLADLEFYRRHPRHKFVELLDNRMDNFSNEEILDFSQGRKKLYILYKDPTKVKIETFK